MYDFEERLYSDAFMDGIVYAAKYFAENGEDKKKEDKENFIKRIWKYGIGKEETQKERKALLDKFDKAYEEARKGDNKKSMREALEAAYANENGIKLNRARLARLGGRAGLIGAGAGIAGGAGYGAYRLSQD